MSTLPDPRGLGGAAKGNRNALKHSARSAETLALKRQISVLARLARETMAVITGPPYGVVPRLQTSAGHQRRADYRRSERDGLALKHGRSEPMLALSIRQPWAWAIIHAGKDVENRSENMARRAERLIGQIILIHAGKTLDHGAFEMLDDFGLVPPNKLPGRNHRVGADRGGYAPSSVALGGARTVADRAHRRAAPAVPPLPGTVGVLPC